MSIVYKIVVTAFKVYFEGNTRKVTHLQEYRHKNKWDYPCFKCHLITVQMNSHILEENGNVLLLKHALQCVNELL